MREGMEGTRFYTNRVSLISSPGSISSQFSLATYGARTTNLRQNRRITRRAHPVGQGFEEGNQLQLLVFCQTEVA